MSEAVRQQVPKVKREPLLADKFLATTYSQSRDWFGAHAHMISRQFFETTRDNLLLAKRFALDSDATRYCAEMVREAPRIIADAMDFAIPPFERTYIELPFLTWFRGITGREPDADSDVRTGYLIAKNIVRVLVEGYDGTVCVYPIQYELNDPFTHQEELDICAKLRSSRLSIDTFMWGESALKFLNGEFITNHTYDISVRNEFEYRSADIWDMEGLLALRANHRFRLMIDERQNDAPDLDKVYGLLCKSSSGDMRNIIALLLFLNRTSKLRYEREVPTETKMWRTRPVPFLKHRAITIKVNPLPKLMRLCAGEGIRRRLHDVRGHLCHNKIARENLHDHEWIESEADHLQWYCECGGLRWWRREHHRGHQDKGIVTANYKVTE